MIEMPLTLPCGTHIPNRLCKAAMTEGLASPEGAPTQALEQLYGIWSDGGAGLLLSGNVQIDGDHLERPGNVIVDRQPSDAMQRALERWAAAGGAKSLRHPRWRGSGEPLGSSSLRLARSG